jgi:hypothetical protein
LVAQSLLALLQVLHINHKSLGSRLQPAAPPNCRAELREARNQDRAKQPDKRVAETVPVARLRHKRLDILLHDSAMLAQRSDFAFMPIDIPAN